MKNQEKSLKSLAKIAKNRLKSTIDLPEPAAKMPPQTEEEKALINKIFEVLKGNFDTPAPLMALIDKQKFDKLSPLEREIYIFDIIDKYNYYRDWYDRKQKETHLVI